ncbi:MAG: xanthine dehydrogenase family protein molybdopterin-binding subunit [Crocosphaera sp.]|uniref:Xanthine dehydrogenase, molybdenum binding subunit n=3 Tax=Crocosphaera watsonii TaxID=263511 RepID=G5IYS6_CROWT|nr:MULTISPECIES: xanthine dehydrogenase family protein molybdopterin-binding subunit [Crocosphaera]EHJ14906.1 Xanthine dehydrogenase, molybdenum binding subunit [Crocosphaera watsonii WH 0003]MCH2247230.1 xanthine dehydrogenase family protein molybdopterin-binding subunit [Crocosphaera sp.]CCQ55772.1 Periplasmic aromatic aldehyde oxidoreductase,molybdenum binding subunit YagR [Crocosphaera watsonii WH 0005]
MSQIIGKSVNRKDGRAKVTGQATYGAEHQISGLVHGYLVTSTIARGSITNIDTQISAVMPGVIEIFTHKNSPKIVTPSNDFINSKIYEARLPLSDNQINYAGQIVGLVVADTFERARDAAQQVKIKYETQTPQVSTETAKYEKAIGMFGEDMEYQEGEFETGDFSIAAAATVKATYHTQVEIHSPMEPHALVAHWENDDSVTIYEPTQWVRGSQKTYAQLFDITQEQVRIISPYIGGGFGGKAFPWPHGILCVAAARVIKRPLKVVVSRRQMTANTGHRSQTEQTIRLSAKDTGKLTAIEHLAKSCTSPVDVFTEPCTGITPVMYATPNIKLKQEIAVLNVGTPTFMRAPGENPGLFALESAMDELAWELKIDPVELRLSNETKEHQRKKLPFSAKNFVECLQTGAEQFGWSERVMKPRSQQKEGRLVGWGMASASFPALRGGGTAKVCLFPNETAHILTSANDMGTGAYTVIAMTAAEALGLPVEKITVKLGDSILPDGGMAGGSQMTASLTPAVLNACQKVLETAQAKNAQEAFAKLRELGGEVYEATASSAPGEEGKKFAFNSWGAHFCEVMVDEEIARLRITRWVSVMNIGRVINSKTATSQIRGGVIMGIGHALMEECHFDPNTGYPVVYDLATYHFPNHADIPHIEVSFVGEPDTNFNPMGVRGCGEIGITGVSAAIANAVYHATGKRIRSLPITPDKLLI